MAKSKKTGGKIVPRRSSEKASEPQPKHKAAPIEPADAEGADIIKVRASVREKNEGFKVIKIVLGVIILLIIGTSVATKLSGAKGSVRGDKLQGEKCEATVECAPGHICYAYQSDRARCMATCSPDKPCQPEYTCKSSLDQKVRKGVTMHNVCVLTSKL
ncbi:MAG: hypothetical protein MUC50_09105 [Myxococcota bacterium]|nr:hypothetical protein [Myxococcota bacterium]